MTQSLGARAARLVGAAMQESAPAPSRQRRRPQKGPDSPDDPQVMHKWKQFAIKYLMILKAYMIKNQIKHALGLETYLRLFGEIRRRTENRAQPQITRVIGNEIVGPVKLPPGKGQILVDPLMCRHPIEFMKPRGNKSSAWWTCLQCQTRWDRLSIASVVPGGIPRDNEIMTFGKHINRSFLKIWNTDPEYCQWTLRTVENEPTYTGNISLRRFAEYVVTKESEKATIGADSEPTHKDKRGRMPESPRSEDSGSFRLVHSTDGF